MFDIKQHTIEDWRDLGFFYDFDKENNRWLLVGSRNGLLHLSEYLKDYVSNPKNNKPGEHKHFLPYSFLTIVTSDVPEITDYGVFGAVTDLENLANLIETKLKISQVGDLIEIGGEYSTDSRVSLLLQVKEDDFDPSSADKFSWLNKK